MITGSILPISARRCDKSEFLRLLNNENCCSITFFTLISRSAFSTETNGCIDGKIKYLHDKKEIVIQERFCYDSVIRSISPVKKCGDKECLINRPGPYSMKLKDVQSEQGSIGFKVCEKLNGVPQFIEYWDTEKWIKTSRCLFDDGSYMDIPALT